MTDDPMTSPESPAVQDTDRLRELIDLGAAKLRAEAKGQHVSYPDVMRIALVAVLPVHRAQVAEEMRPFIAKAVEEGIAQALAEERAAVRRLAASTPPGSPPAAERAVPGETGTVGRQEVSWAEASAIATEQLLDIEARRAALADREAAAFPGETGPDWLTDELIDAGADALKVAANRDGDPGWTAETCSAGHLDCELVPASQIVGSPRAIAAAVLRSVVEYADAPTLAVSSPAAAAVPGTGDDPAACARCRRPFDPDDKDVDGAARYGESKFCRGCVDRCHESTDAFHECPVCAS